MHDSVLDENVYGHQKRLNWIISQLKKDDLIIEFGCGTGYMICLPLTLKGYNVRGVDLDKKSIDFGRAIFCQNELSDNLLMTKDIVELDITPNVIIASEVFEHLPDQDLHSILEFLSKILKPGGTLIVTVPNGYGWFEMENFLWVKARLGRLMDFLNADHYITKIKTKIWGSWFDDRTPSTLSNSPHVQRFTYGSIQKKLANHGFVVAEITGSTLFAGPLSNLLFAGIAPLLKINCTFGRIMPRVASGFYIACRAPIR